MDMVRPVLIRVFSQIPSRGEYFQLGLWSRVLRVYVVGRIQPKGSKFGYLAINELQENIRYAL